MIRRPPDLLWPIAAQDGYLSGAPRFTWVRVAAGQFGCHILNGGTAASFTNRYGIEEHRLDAMFDLLPETLPCGVTREQIRGCVMRNTPVDALYFSTALTARELEIELKKAWLWDADFSFWWGTEKEVLDSQQAAELLPLRPEQLARGIQAPPYPDD